MAEAALSGKPIKDIYEELGFGHASTFHAPFKKMFGKTVRQYRLEHARKERRAGNATQAGSKSLGRGRQPHAYFAVRSSK
jgi:AraC-like DNA-binding protein